MEPLPVDAFLPHITAAVLERGALVLTAEPGAGKTTRVPPALLEALPQGQVLVLEPRRLAARLAARRVASERGGRVGDEVGYQVRFEQRTGPRTRLVYLTEGVLVRRLARGADALEGVAAVVLDEFHERHLEGDLTLVLLDRLRRQGRGPRLVVMSATLERERLAAHLDAPSLAVPGRLHPVSLEHAPRRDDRRLEDKVHDAVRTLADEEEGHVLVFLPGVGEIERCQRALGGLARGRELDLLPLHGRLSPEDMERALRPSARRKVLLATNVAESSVTIDGVRAVVDSGLARVAGQAAGGLPTLELQPISQASATQRAGRAGRQAPGRCLRLYTRNDHDHRPRDPLPELLREDLTGPLLTLSAAGVEDAAALPWLDPPPAAQLEAARDLLLRLGAVDEAGITALGRDLLRFPLSPGLARVVLEGRRRGVGEQAAAAAALLSERDLRRTTRGRPPAPDHEAPSDVLLLLDLLAEARRARFDPRKLRRMDVDPGAARRVDQVRAQLLRAGPRVDAPPAQRPEAALLQALLAGHPDRVARRLRPGQPQLALALGGSAALAAESCVREAEWLVALDARDPQRHGQQARVHLASAIDPEWLLELFPDFLREAQRVEWDAARERVECSWRLSYGQLDVESAAEEGDPEQVAACLRRAARAAGPEAFTDRERLESWLLRAAFARGLDEDLPAFDRAWVEEQLDAQCEGKRSFAELRRADLLEVIEGALPWELKQRLEALAPEHVTLPGGRRLQVHYEARQEPWVQSRLQDFFGAAAGPTVGAGRVPLVLHLLAPNKTAVSVTKDLAGFWERHYPSERKRLSRRYPKHLWPEDPRTAKPPRPGRIR